MLKDSVKKCLETIIENWKNHPDFKQLVNFIENDKKNIFKQVKKIFKNKRKSEKTKNNEARMFLYEYAVKKIQIDPRIEQFIFSNDRETVEIIFEDVFGFNNNPDKKYTINFNYIKQLSELITECLFTNYNSNEVINFLKYFFDKPGVSRDRIMRYKTILWFSYLIIDIIIIDDLVCDKGPNYLKEKIQELMNAIEEEMIISQSDIDNACYDDGLWENSLFAYLQGEDRKNLFEQLNKQFNFLEIQDNNNRLLIAEQRRCIYRKAHNIFCVQ